MKQMDNRQPIMEKALELFCARGYDAVGFRRSQNSPELQNQRCIIILAVSRD